MPSRPSPHRARCLRPAVAAVFAALAASAGCALEAAHPPPSPPAAAEPDPGPILDASRPAPRFLVQAEGGARLASEEWVGVRPFAVVTFASWCHVCEAKLPIVRRVAERHPSVALLVVSADEEETWPRVAAFVRRHGLAGAPLVRATSFPRFAGAYAPHATVPTVVVVGREGRPIEYQRGLTDEDDERLELAFSLAERGGAAGQRAP
ncbi:MAG: TlpA family protein disulfide reductase [Polyangiaceae bacterium]|nr:TlpA family protein disulfide reductase [Polyangiaceae bacterium]